MNKIINIRMPDGAKMTITIAPKNVVKLESNLKVTSEEDKNGDYIEFNTAIYGMEALILAMVYQKVDIEQKNIIEAIKCAYAEIAVRF